MNRFTDQNLRSNAFYGCLLVVCPRCEGKAELIRDAAGVTAYRCSRCGPLPIQQKIMFTAQVTTRCENCDQCIDIQRSYSKEKRHLLCTCPHCGHRKQTPAIWTSHTVQTIEPHKGLWLQQPFRGHLFTACNEDHLAYLKQYIQAGLRERNNRQFFTLVEKLPQWMKSAKNREGLLKVIARLEAKG